ncbi:hypothetical protein [Halomonas sp. M20]|nr:hypothetical protein [Halomonas sp. M20]
MAIDAGQEAIRYKRDGRGLPPATVAEFGLLRHAVEVAGLCEGAGY